MYVELISASFVGIKPTDVTHRSINLLYMKLIFKADWKPMERPDGRSMLGEIFVQRFRPCNGLIEENLMKTIVLRCDSALRLRWEKTSK